MTIPPRLMAGAPAPDSILLDAAGQTVHLRDFWQAGPVLLALLRHFG